jgi:flagellar motor protein MotB
MIDDYSGLIKKTTKINLRSLVLEVSYAKLFNKNYKGVAVNGLKQSIDIIKKINNNYSKDIYITGYTDPQNIASEYVLETNGFTKLSQQITYINELSNIWIKKIK